ncbi:MAG TPA: 1-deoxy-D-xylulose-5-phosphate synthase [Candidatus Acidoferrum sp.]|nr:1-deoxy-D-xylulose-5-phosphate synthase [Candidatus Acidoferrum sp.]
MKYLPDISGPADLKKLSVDQLPELADEIRQEIVTVVSETGGHLASNLGAIELTVALHYVYDFLNDRLVWDVSHQTYAHKILTGRRDQIQSIRQYEGLSGYAKREESPYDHFGAGHASTSISAALGFAVSRDLAGEDRKVVAVIGDGAMTGGLAFEGMNNAGSLKKNLLVILNDNTWSISRNVGAISKYLTSLMADEKIQKLRSEVWELTGKFKRRDKIRETIHRIENSLKGLLVPGIMFEKLGFKYFGPIDGHDLPLLVKTLKDLKNLNGPVMLHVATVKGKGYAPAEDDAFKYHGVGKFDKTTGKSSAAAPVFPSYTQVFGNIMTELAEKDKRVVAITAAMCSGTGLVEFSEKYPERFFDVGIAEAHATCFAGGLAADGNVRPYVAIYSTFLQRAYDQVIHDLAIQNLAVVICMDRAGLVGDDGPTHHGVFDITYLSTVPNVTLVAPKDGNELRAVLHHTLDHQVPGIVAVRYPRDNVPVAMKDEIGAIEWGKWEWLTPQHEIVILAVGTMVSPAVKAAAMLEEKGIDVSVVNCRFVKPFDRAMLDVIKADARAVITVEEGVLRGGFGQGIAEYLLSNEFEGKFKALGLPDSFVTHGSRAQLLKDVGLDAEGIFNSVDQFLSQHHRAGGFLQRLVFRKNGSGHKKDFLKNAG